MMIQLYASLHAWENLNLSSRLLLPLAWPSPGYCEHLGVSQ